MSLRILNEKFMNKTQLPPSETRYDDLHGIVSVNFKEEQNFNTIAANITGYDPAKFEAVALRVFIYEHNPVVTLYAIDKEKQPFSLRQEKLPVRKFKLEMSFEEIFKKFKSLNFTLTLPDYKIEDMEVVE